MLLICFNSFGQEWKKTVFGDIGGTNKITEENFEIKETESGGFLLRSSNNRGKISSRSEGITYAYKEIDNSDDFILTATATVKSFYLNNQVSFGLMVRDKVYENTSTKKDLGSYLALGPLDTKRDQYKFFFSRNSKGLEKDGLVYKTPKPIQGVSYDLTLIKSGNSYAFYFAGEKLFVRDNFEDFNSDKLYIGMFTSRNCEIEFSNINLEITNSAVKELVVDRTAAKINFLIGEELDYKDFNVTALLHSGEEKTLTEQDFFIGGYDSTEAQSLNLNFHYKGASVSLPAEVNELSVTDLKVIFPPLKSFYYPLDRFDPTGIQVDAVYNEGYHFETLDKKNITLTINGKRAASFIFNEPGEYKVKIQSVDNPEVFSNFSVEVKDAKIKSIDIDQLPVKRKYFQGDEFDPAGMVVYAKYSDGKKVRLFGDDYEISYFDSSKPGSKTITVKYKDKTDKFRVKVNKIKVEKLIITKYPRTTYDLDEEFDPSGIEVSKLYNNEIIVPLRDREYRVERTKEKLVKVIPVDKKLKSISFPLTVKKLDTPEWKTIKFGQSITSEKNYINFRENGVVEIAAVDGGGKITGDHDGITFYYTEIDAETENFILEGDVTVYTYAKSPQDGQESFGIMARDAIGTPDDSSIFASNIVAIGGVSGGTKYSNATKLIKREGITSPDGAGSLGTLRKTVHPDKPALDNTYPQQSYRLRLEKTNSGYVGSLNGKDEEYFWTPDILNVQDSKVYVGFYAARWARIEVQNITYHVSESKTDAPKITPPPEPLKPEFLIFSPTEFSVNDYNLVMESSVDGTLFIKHGDKVIEEELKVEMEEEIVVPLTLESQTENAVSIVFYPDDKQFLTSYDPIINYMKVDHRTYQSGKDIYVDTFGDELGDGSKELPLDLETAINFVSPGQKIILADGEYKRKTPLMINKYNDGTEDNYKYLLPAEGARPIINFQYLSAGVIHSGNFWNVKGIDFIKSAGNYKGYNVGGNYNIIEECRFYNNGDTGLQISRTDILEDDKTRWPSHNLILNCESFDNSDPSQNNGDGFAAKLTSGVGNIFRGCVAYNNIDDGWDLYTKAGHGAIGAVLLEDCIAYNNGFLSNGLSGAGDKNGFKLGGEGIVVNHILKNCLAFGNGRIGITNNSNPGLIIENSFSINNGGDNVSLLTYTGIEPEFTINGIYSYKNSTGEDDSYPSQYESEINYFFDGNKSLNKSGDELVLDKFIQSLKTNEKLSNYINLIQ